MSWPSWQTYSGRSTHISGHPSSVGQAQDRESSPVKDQRSTAAPRNQRSAAVEHYGPEKVAVNFLQQRLQILTD